MEGRMANYDPAQPLWKRNLAAILDFLLVLIVLGFALSKLPSNHPPPLMSGPAGTTTVQLFGVGGWPALLLLIGIIAYFIVLGRTGGTVFQRLFGMKRAG
jgi:hypothetical protein